jgi:hypothetical protein
VFPSCLNGPEPCEVDREEGALVVQPALPLLREEARQPLILPYPIFTQRTGVVRIGSMLIVCVVVCVLPVFACLC